jgi:hypothetical protein
MQTGVPQKGDISTLEKKGHFYFGLTGQTKQEMIL